MIISFLFRSLFTLFMIHNDSCSVNIVVHIILLYFFFCSLHFTYCFIFTNNTQGQNNLVFFSIKNSILILLMKLRLYFCFMLRIWILIMEIINGFEKWFPTYSYGFFVYKYQKQKFFFQEIISFLKFNMKKSTFSSSK
jgi:hypothetical protein